ncbi:MAG: NAD-dependent epimerase/dehydratase family protein [Rikenellaceae bacterium]
MKIVVSGANGMLATNIIEQLLHKGYEVRGLLRRESSYQGIQHKNLELVEGDFTNLEYVNSSIDGCECVIHSAAITKQNLPHYESYHQVNSCATEQLIKVAVAKGVKRFVFVSSANTIGYGTPESPSTEHTPMMAPFSNSFYARSKKSAEDIVLSYSKSTDVVVVNPTLMIGKYGTKKGSNQILHMARTITLCTSGGKSIIDVEQAALGIIAAFERGRSGEKYLISGENLSFKEFFQRFSSVRHIIVVPKFILLCVGFIGSLLRHFSILSVPSLVDIQSILVNPGYSNKRLETELGFRPKTLAECGIFDNIDHK